jgi:predicted nucleotidyltransferase
MTRKELIDLSEAYIRHLFKEHIPSEAKVYLYGSRSRGDNRWNSDYDLWIDADISRQVMVEMTDRLEESFVPFTVELVMTPELKGRFGELVKQEAIPWM